eukprot:jgi/Chrpa1/3229/Chrysochromulina_OHIO_Genome00013810-RA
MSLNNNQCPVCRGTNYGRPSTLSRHVRDVHGVYLGGEDSWVAKQRAILRARRAAQQAPSTTPPSHSLLAPSTHAPRPPPPPLPQHPPNAAAAPATSMPPPPPLQQDSKPPPPPPHPSPPSPLPSPKRPRETSATEVLRPPVPQQKPNDAPAPAAAVAVAVASAAASTTAAVAAAVASSAPVPQPTPSTGLHAADGAASAHGSLTHSASFALLKHWHRNGQIDPRAAAALLDAFAVSNAHGVAAFRAYAHRMRPQP